MKHTTFLFCLLTNLSSYCVAQRGHADEKQTIQRVVTGFFNGLAALDVEQTKAYCTPDITLLESGSIWNFDSLALRIITRKAKSADFKRINKLDFLATKQTGKTAWVYYANQATMTASGKTIVVKWLESVFLRKEQQQWRIELLHSTEVARSQ